VRSAAEGDRRAGRDSEAQNLKLSLMGLARSELPVVIALESYN
jgi:hypothetical protein